MGRVLIIQPALAPYRVDFFNDVAKQIPNTHFFFYRRQMISQPILIDDYDTTFDYSIGVASKFKKWRPLIRFFRVFYALLQTLFKQRPCVIVTNEFSLITIFLALYCRIAGKQHVAWTDDSLDNVKQSSFFRKIRRAFVLNLSNGLVVCNPNVRDHFQRRLACKVESVELLQKESVFGCLLQGAIPRANEYIEQYHLIEKKVVLFVGRLVEVKNLPSLLSAFANFDDDQTMLVLVGSGELDDELCSVVEKCGISDRVIFTGRQCGEALYAWYLIARLFVLPSVSERFGAVVNEALLAGMPVLCSKYAGASCLIKNGINGAVVDPDNIAALSRILSEWIKKIDPVPDRIRLRDSLMCLDYQDSVDKFVKMVS